MCFLAASWLAVVPHTHPFGPPTEVSLQAVSEISVP